MRGGVHTDDDDGTNSRDARSPRGAIVWIAISLLIGTLAGLEVVGATDDGHIIDCVVDGGLVLCVVFAAGLRLARRWLQRPSTTVVAAIAAAAFGVVNGTLGAAFDRADGARSFAVDDSQLVSIDGVVMADPVARVDGSRLRLPGEDQLSRFMRRPPGVTMQLAAGSDRERRYEVQLAARPFPIRAGDRLRVRGWLEPDAAPRNPGGFDSAAARRRRGEVGRVIVEDPALVTRITSADAPTLGAGDQLRAVLARGLVRSLGSATSPAVRDMVVTMTLGTRGETLPAVRSLFARTGLSHFIVISGFHLAVIAGALLFVARRAGFGRRACGLVLFGASLFFLFLLDSQVSVVRAGLAGLVTGAVLLLGRGWSAISILALVTIAVLVVDPEAAAEAAFQLSFTAVAALLLLARPIDRLLCASLEGALAPRSWIRHRLHPHIRRRAAAAAMSGAQRSVRGPIHHQSFPHPDALRRVVIARILAKPVSTAVAAWIVTTPITLHHFGQIAGWGVIGSAALGPIASIMAIVGLPAALLGAVTPILAVPAGWVLAVSGTLFLEAVECISHLPGACVRFPPQPGWWCALMVVLPFVCARAWRTIHRSRAIVVVLLFAIGAISLRPWWPSSSRSLEVVSLDLGFGRCVLVRCGTRAVLIDAGSRNAPTAGSRTVVPALVDLGALRLDAIIVTERSMQCISALPEVLRAASVAKLIVPESMLEALPESAPALLLACASGQRVPVKTLASGEDLELSLASRDEPLLVLRLLAESASPTDATSITVSIHGAQFTGSVPSLAASAIDGGRSTRAPQVGGARSVSGRRGARLWRCDPISGWTAHRFGHQGWTPAPIVE